MKLIQKVDTRRTWMGQWVRAITAVLCLVFMVSTPAEAVNSFDPFPMGWFDSLRGTNHPTLMAADTNEMSQGSNISLAYWGSSTAAERQTYLNNATAAGVDVFMEVDPALILAEDAAGISSVASLYDSHPAVIGWYTADEPHVHGTTLSTLQIAYDAIKAVSTKPVTIAFSEPGVAAGTPVSFKTAYDIFFADAYPCRTDQSEFSGFDIEPSGYPYKDDFKGDMARAKAQSLAAGRPWFALLQGWGDEFVGERNYRLPTNNESKFMTFYPLLLETYGILHFVYYRALSVPAAAGQPFPYDGQTWLEEVMTMRNDEVNLLGPALREGSIGSNAFSADNVNIIGDVFQDLGTDTFYIIALNDTTGARTPSITLNLQGLPPETPVAVWPLFEGSIAPILLMASGTQFTDDFSSYEVHIYQVVYEYEPPDCPAAIAAGYRLYMDFNNDCYVNLPDLVLFAENWFKCMVPGVPGCQTPWNPQ